MTKYSDNLIPAMTSYNTPTGLVECSSVFDSGNNPRYGWKAFNHGTSYNLDTDGWTGQSGNDWISYTFPKLTNISKIEIFNCPEGLYLDNWNQVKVYGDDVNLIGTFDRNDLNAITTSQYTLYTLELESHSSYNKYTLSFNDTSYTYIYEIKMYSVLVDFLLKQDSNYISLKEDYYHSDTDLYDKYQLSTLDKDSFINYGIEDLSSIHYNALNKLIDNKYNIAMMK